MTYAMPWGNPYLPQYNQGQPVQPMQPTQSRMSYNAMPSNNTSGYGMTNQNDPISIIRDTMSTASPEMRAQLRNEISGFMNM